MQSSRYHLASAQTRPFAPCIGSDPAEFRRRAGERVLLRALEAGTAAPVAARLSAVGALSKDRFAGLSPSLRFHYSGCARFAQAILCYAVKNARNRCSCPLLPGACALPGLNVPGGNLQHIFSQLSWLRTQAHDCAHAALLLGNFVQHLKSDAHIRGGARAVLISMG